MRQLYSLQLAAATGALILLVTAIFALLQNPELLDITAAASVKKASATPHPIKGYERCDSCHGLRGASPYPLDHTGWSNESCTRCHLPGVLPKQSMLRPLHRTPAAYESAGPARMFREGKERRDEGAVDP